MGSSVQYSVLLPHYDTGHETLRPSVYHPRNLASDEAGSENTYNAPVSVTGQTTDATATDKKTLSVVISANET